MTNTGADLLIKHTLSALPIVAGLFLKIAGLTLIPQMMAKAFQNLLLTSSRVNPAFRLDEDQRAIVIGTLANEALRTTTLLGLFIAEFDVVLLLISHFTLLGLVVLVGFSFLLIVALFILLPKHPMELSEPHYLGLTLRNLIIYSLCCIDVLLVTLIFLRD